MYVFLLQQQHFVPVSEPSIVVTSASTESSVVSKMQDTLPVQQPSTNKVPTTTSNIPHAIHASPSIPAGVSRQMLVILQLNILNLKNDCKL